MGTLQSSSSQACKGCLDSTGWPLIPGSLLYAWPGPETLTPGPRTAFDWTSLALVICEPACTRDFPVYDHPAAKDGPLTELRVLMIFCVVCEYEARVHTGILIHGGPARGRALGGSRRPCMKSWPAGPAEVTVHPSIKNPSVNMDHTCVSCGLLFTFWSARCSIRRAAQLPKAACPWAMYRARDAPALRGFFG